MRTVRRPPGQTLTMSLGSGLSGKLINYAEIDLELKFGATVRVTGLLNGTPVGRTGDLHVDRLGLGSGLGGRRQLPDPLPEVGHDVRDQIDFEIGSTGEPRHSRVEPTEPVPATCDAMRRHASRPVNFSLGQTLDTTDSLFHLVEVDGVLDCPSGTDRQATRARTGAVRASWIALENVGGAACTPIPFNLDSGPAWTSRLHPRLASSASCCRRTCWARTTQFFWTVTWDARDRATTRRQPTQFDFGPTVPASPALPGADADGDGLPQLPPDASRTTGTRSIPWCIIDTHDATSTRSRVSMTVTETYFGGGDPGGKRGVSRRGSIAGNRHDPKSVGDRGGLGLLGRRCASSPRALRQRRPRVQREQHLELRARSTSRRQAPVEAPPPPARDRERRRSAHPLTRSSSGS